MQAPDKTPERLPVSARPSLRRPSGDSLEPVQSTDLLKGAEIRRDRTQRLNLPSAGNQAGQADFDEIGLTGAGPHQGNTRLGDPGIRAGSMAIRVGLQNKKRASAPHHF